MNSSDAIRVLVAEEVNDLLDRYGRLLAVMDSFGGTLSLKTVLGTFLGLLDLTDTAAIVKLFSDDDVKNPEASDADFAKLANFFKTLHELKQQGVAINAREQELRDYYLHRN